jgi:signal transduction histidine kinase
MSAADPVPKADILVIDDDRALRVYLAGLLSQQDYQVRAVATGADALAVAETRPPDLILLDVMLPDTDGYELCRALKAAPGTVRTPVIFLTAKGHEPEILRGFESGGVDYIVKPFAATVLLARVATHVTLARLSRGLHSALDERSARLEQANRRLRELNIQMATLEERQRRQLAQQLHDTTIQQLVLARILVDGETDLERRRAQLDELLADSIRQLRSLVFELSPSPLHTDRLDVALEWLTTRISEQWQLTVDCECAGRPPALSDALALTLFQGARELLINAAKHAEARRLVLRLDCDGDLLRVCVADDGRGFDRQWLAPDDAHAPGEPAAGGFGLYSLRSRIELLGGCLLLRNLSPRGAEACLSIRLGDSAQDRPCC